MSTRRESSPGFTGGAALGSEREVTVSDEAKEVREGEGGRGENHRTREKGKRRWWKGEREGGSAREVMQITSLLSRPTFLVPLQPPPLPLTPPSSAPSEDHNN